MLGCTEFLAQAYFLGDSSRVCAFLKEFEIVIITEQTM